MSERKESKVYYDLADDLIRMADKYIYREDVLEVLNDLTGYLAHARRNLKGIIKKIEQKGIKYRQLGDDISYTDLMTRGILEQDQANGVIYVYREEQYEPIELLELLKEEVLP